MVILYLVYYLFAVRFSMARYVIFFSRWSGIYIVFAVIRNHITNRFVSARQIVVVFCCIGMMETLQIETTFYCVCVCI